VWSCLGRIAGCLSKRDAGLEASNEGDDVAPIAGRAVEVEGRDGVDLGAGRKDCVETEALWQDADDGGLLAIDVERFSNDGGIRGELAFPPTVGEEDDGRCAVAGVVWCEGAAMAG
jgi:hypothetical protein